MNLRLLGLLAVAAAALMAFTGSASATILTSPEGTTYTGNIYKTSTNVTVEGSFTPVQCAHSIIQGTVVEHGSTFVVIQTSSFDFTGCNHEAKVKASGTLRIDSSNNITSTGAEVSIATSVGTCVFTTNGTKIGTLNEGTNASMSANSVKVPRTGGNFLCGSSGTLKATYDLTTPNDLWVD